jgi:hypothetical protein
MIRSAVGLLYSTPKKKRPVNEALDYITSDVSLIGAKHPHPLRGISAHVM